MIRPRSVFSKLEAIRLEPLADLLAYIAETRSQAA